MKILNQLFGAIVSVVILISCNIDSEQTFSTNSFSLSINEASEISNLLDSKTNQVCSATIEKNGILGIQVNGTLEYPATMELETESNLLKLNYPNSGINATVNITTNDDYLTLELVELSNVEKVELVTWGPFKTSIKETIGETIGVVRNSDYAIGIQSLNPRTLGGFPTASDEAPQFDIFGTTSLVDVADSLNILYRGHTAYPRDYGSSLQAFTRNRSKERIIENLNHEKYVAPAYKDGGVIGSKIALFGTHPDDVLNTIEKIELNEGLPHPMLNGVWAKKAKEASSAYLIQSFNEKNIEKAIELTKKAGLKYVYHDGPFENWGQFDLKEKSFPNNWETMKEIVEKAEKEGVKVGVHTLSNFITTNDPYVTPVPDKRLAIVGKSVLVKSITATEKTIEIKDPTYFNQMKNNSLHAIVVGDEIIRYERVSETAPWQLLNCERGAFNTKASAHDANTEIKKLIDHAYKTFLSNAELTVEMSNTLAKLYNETGLKQISFDGLEGNLSTGMGEYGELLMTKTWYDQLKPEIKNDFVMDASRPGHYFWHMFTRMNWGEPWYADFRESQTSYRILNQDYFRRNYIPSMLGWFSMRDNTSIEDIEWMLARSAGFDAGYALVTSDKLVSKNGFGAEILEKINQWEQARMGGAFSVEQKKKMEDIKTEYTLETISEGNWNLIPFDVNRFEHKLIVRQPGEPVWSTFDYENPNDTQPLQFILKTTNNSTASNLFIEIDNFKKLDLNISIPPNQYLKYDGKDKVVLYDKSWNKVESITIDPEKLTMAKGAHKIKIDCKFRGSDSASLKLEIKTKGTAEAVSLN